MVARERFELSSREITHKIYSHKFNGKLNPKTKDNTPSYVKHNAPES